jgi:membrane-associated phospholipid phosphatase
VKHTPKYILAQLLSYGLHPGSLPTVGTLYIIYALPQIFSLESIVRMMSIVLVGTYIIPVIVIYIMTLLGIIESVHLINKKDRIYPYTITTLSALLTSRILTSMGAPVEIIYCSLGCAFILVVSAVLIPFFKSSAHLAGITGFAGLYLGMNEKYGSGEFKNMLIIILLCIALAWARIYLKRHTLKEVLTGSILGFGSIYLLISK